MITLLLTLVILGLGMYLIERYVPMAEPIKIIFRVVVIMAIVVWLLNSVGYPVPLHLH